MDVRFFDPEKDSIEELSKLNPFTENWQAWMRAQYEAMAPALSRNLVVAESEGTLVGCLHIFDAGHPWAILDGWYLDPAYRGLANAKKLGYFAVEELKSRGIHLVMMCVPTNLGRVLTRYDCKEHIDFSLMTKVI